MNLALLFHSVFPRRIQGLKRWWASHTPARTVPAAHVVHTSPCDAPRLRRGVAQWPHCERATQRPLRILTVHEAGQPQFSVGRMVISGSMADVCAELDRLAAWESAAS
jgi:hypothetical protein